jgi:hypothetical protein
MSKFKINDLIKVTGINNTLNDKIKIGDTRTVTSTISDGVQLDDILNGWIHDVDIEIAEDTSKPVTVKAHGVVQNVTYTLSGAGEDFDVKLDWFEPYLFDHDDNCKIPLSNNVEWMLLPEAGN